MKVGARIVLGTFIRNYPSYFWLFVSTIFMAFFFEAGFWPVCVHFGNLAILLFARYEARKAENYFVTIVAIMVSLGLTAVMLYPPSWWHFGILAVNFGLLLLMCKYAQSDISNFPQKTAT